MDICRAQVQIVVVVIVVIPRGFRPMVVLVS
jgi:hypothetical protein